MKGRQYACRGLNAAAVPPPTVVRALCFDFNQVYMPLVRIQLMRLPHAVGCCGPLCGVVSAA
eukprot:319308-Pelagomonas_calceolata.AAC.2